MRVLFAVHAWGLGHATRDLVLIKGLLERGHEVTILSTERAMHLLRCELGERCTFVELADIPKPLSRRAAWLFYLKMSLASPLLFWTYCHEQWAVRQLWRKYRFDRIVSDTRYGIAMRDVPSYYILHSLRQVIPGRPRYLELFVERLQEVMLAKARKILIPDQEENGLAGDLCHNLACSWKNQLEYIGILSSVERMVVEPDVDYFISVSGAEPQRSVFEEIVLQQAYDIGGRVVITLGKPDVPLTASDNGRVAVYSYLGRQQQAEMMNRAKLVVSRSGYTTLMELAELGKRALFIPTVGQSEQEYLGAYHEKLGNMHSVLQPHLELQRDVPVAERYPGISAEHSTAESVAKFLALVEG